MSNLIVGGQAGLPANVSPELLERIKEVRENLESVETFKLPRVKMTGDGFELIDGENAVKEIEGTILHTRKTNVYYSRPYNPSDVGPPDCFSQDGVKPDASVKNPVNPTCKGCKMAEFGTNSMKSGKACRNLKPIYLLLSDEAIMPRQLVVTPTSLKEANNFLMNLTERGLAYRKVKVKIVAEKENKADTYCKLKFSLVGKLAEPRLSEVEFLKTQWLAVMNNQIIENETTNEGSPDVKEESPKTAQF